MNPDKHRNLKGAPMRLFFAYIQKINKKKLVYLHFFFAFYAKCVILSLYVGDEEKQKKLGGQDER